MQQAWNSFWNKKRAWAGKKESVSFSKRRIMGILNKFVLPGATVLDAGCGSGFFSRYFLQQGCVVDALDYSDSALQHTREITEGRCRQYFTQDLLQLDSTLNAVTYDIVFTDGLLEHFTITEQERLLETFSLLKKPQGLVVTFVPNRYSPWQLIRPFLMPGVKERPFTLNRLLDLHHRFQIVERGGLNVLPCPFPLDNILGKRFGMLLFVVAR